MISRFLRAKHWQLFILIFGIPFMVQTVFWVAVFGEPGELGGLFDPLAEVFEIFILGVPTVMLILLITWFYSVGSGLQVNVPVELRRPTRLFKVALVFPVVYILLIIAVVFPFLGVLATSVIGGGFIMLIILALHLFVMFCIMYSMYFTAKTIKLAQLKREVTFGDFVGEFFLFWCVPVGIWFLQPQINKLVAEASPTPIDEEYV